MVERCGDRQRKFNGLERWPFRLFIESLSVILQIALLLLACGLSQYVWSVNVSVARVVISFTILGMLFYAGIVVAGTFSYECPFQTPVSLTLGYLRDSGMVQKLLASISPPKVTLLTYATWINIRRRLVSASRHAYATMRYQLSRRFSLSRLMSGIRGTATKLGHQTIILLLQIDRAFWNTKQRLVQRIRKLRRAGLLPTTIEDAPHQLPAPRNGPQLRVHVWNLEAIQRQNTDNMRCVCWVLRNITDPEAIDSAIRLVGIIRWFDGDSDHDPPFDLIFSTFEACFDSTKRPYPGMRDRAYFSARAILQINAGARLRSHACASKYPIPAISSSSFQQIDPDLRHAICMLELNLGVGTPTLDFPREDANTHPHSLWMSNLFVDLIRVDPGLTLRSYQPYLSTAIANHQGTITNTLLMWYMLLGGNVDEETFWATDKSYAVAALSFLSVALNRVYQ